MGIKPCPFCAKRTAKIHKFNDRCFTITCPCGAESPNDSVSEKGAIRIWNRRRLSQIAINAIHKFCLKGYNLNTVRQLSNDKPSLVKQVQEIVEKELCEK